MEFENENIKILNKILARNSSVRCSSRIYYYGSGEGVPFKWEMQPGIARDPPKEDILPPLSPPPALLSLGLPKPCFQVPKPSTSWSRLRFWKRSRRSGKGKKLQECNRDDVDGLDTFARLECSSGSDSLASPRNLSFSSSSSSLSLIMKSRPSLQSTRSESPPREIYGRPFSNCIPMHISRILVSIVTRD